MLNDIVVMFRYAIKIRILDKNEYKRTIVAFHKRALIQSAH